MPMTKWRKQIWKGHILYNYKWWHSGKAEKYGNSKNISGFQGLEEKEEWIDGAQRIFLSSEPILYDIIMMATYHTLVKTKQSTPPRANPNIHYGLWVIMMYKGRFIKWNKYTSLIQPRMLTVGETVPVWEQGVDMGNFCIFCSILLWT